LHLRAPTFPLLWLYLIRNILRDILSHYTHFCDHFRGRYRNNKDFKWVLKSSHMQKMHSFLMGEHDFVIKHQIKDVKLPQLYVIYEILVRTYKTLSFKPKIVKMQTFSVYLIT
jgi:hypothetical protein